MSVEFEGRTVAKMVKCANEDGYDRGFSDGWDAHAEHVQAILEVLLPSLLPTYDDLTWAIKRLKDLLRGEP